MSVLDNIENPAKNIDTGGTLTDILSGKNAGFSLIDFIFLIAGLIFFFNIIISGWEYFFSAGDPQKVASAGSRLLNGFVGLAIVLASFLIVRLISSMIGLDNLI